MANGSYDKHKLQQLQFYHSFCEVTDSVSTDCKNDMWTKIINSCRLRSQNCLNTTTLKV